MDLGVNDVQLLTDGEIAELNEAADRGQQRSDELRARLAEQLRALLSRLTRLERGVLTARFGLDGRAPERPADVAERLGMSVGRVRRLERRALAKLARSARSPVAEPTSEEEETSDHGREAEPERI